MMLLVYSYHLCVKEYYLQREVLKKLIAVIWCNSFVNRYYQQVTLIDTLWCYCYYLVVVVVVVVVDDVVRLLKYHQKQMTLVELSQPP